MPPPKTIILVKKAKSHAGHHGGAWKVAYADFVTALMALFIVLWLMNTSPNVRKAVAGYFNDQMGRSTLTGTDRAGASDNLPITKDNIAQLKQRLENNIQQMKDLKPLKNQIEITVTPEGLRIELLETKDGTFFDTGSAMLNARGREILALLAQQLRTVPNRVSIEGHTDAQPYSGAANYSNWELSTDRANAARRLMQTTGLRPNQVSEVRGYADQQLRVPSNPLDPSNRRISLIVQYLHPSAPLATEEQVATEEHPAETQKPATESSPASLAKPTPAHPMDAAGTASSSGFASKIMNSRLARKLRGR
jgi:chemotaxis protein MotB